MVQAHSLLNCFPNEGIFRNHKSNEVCRPILLEHGVTNPELELIQKLTKTVIDGLHYKVRVSVRKWVHTPLYNATNFLNPPPSYSPPFQSNSSSSTSCDSGVDDNDSLSIPRQIMLQIVEDRDLLSLLPKIRNYLLDRRPEVPPVGGARQCPLTTKASTIINHYLLEKGQSYLLLK
jgi:hypothetical protein